MQNATILQRAKELLGSSQISTCITTLELLRGNHSIRNREDRYRNLEHQYLLMELGWNHDRNRPFRGMSAVFLFTNL